MDKTDSAFQARGVGDSWKPLFWPAIELTWNRFQCFEILLYIARSVLIECLGEV